MAAVSSWDGILLTGRGRGDDGRPTCRGATRPDHIVVTSGLFALPYDVSFPAPHELGDAV